MRTAKFLSFLGLITFLSLIYVWQQTEIFRLAYKGQKSLSVFEDLLAKNTILRYNIEKNASLTRLGDRVSEVADFQMPDSYRLVKLAYSTKNSRASKQLSKRENAISRFFSIKRQAEARTINSR